MGENKKRRTQQETDPWFLNGAFPGGKANG